MHTKRKYKRFSKKRHFGGGDRYVLSQDINAAFKNETEFEREIINCNFPEKSQCEEKCIVVSLLTNKNLVYKIQSLNWYDGLRYSELSKGSDERIIGTLRNGDTFYFKITDNSLLDRNTRSSSYLSTELSFASPPNIDQSLEKIPVRSDAELSFASPPNIDQSLEKIPVRSDAVSARGTSESVTLNSSQYPENVPDGKKDQDTEDINEEIIVEEMTPLQEKQIARNVPEESYTKKNETKTMSILKSITEYIAPTVIPTMKLGQIKDFETKKYEGSINAFNNDPTLFDKLKEMSAKIAKKMKTKEDSSESRDIIESDQVSTSPTPSNTELENIYFVILHGYSDQLYSLFPNDVIIKDTIQGKMNFSGEDYLSPLEFACYCKRAPAVDFLIELIKKNCHKDVITKYIKGTNGPIYQIIEGQKKYYGASDLIKKIWRRTPFTSMNPVTTTMLVIPFIWGGVNFNSFWSICWQMLWWFPPFWVFYWGFICATSKIAGGIEMFLALPALMLCFLRTALNKVYTILKILAAKAKNHITRKYAKPRAFCIMKIINVMIDCDDKEGVNNSVQIVYEYASQKGWATGRRENPQMLKVLYDIHNENANGNIKVLTDEQEAVCKGAFWNTRYHNFTRKWTGYGGRRRNKTSRRFSARKRR